MKQYQKTGIILLSCIFLVSCGTQFQAPSKMASNWERKIEKNYTIGQLKTVSVGESMVVQKDFYYREVFSDTVEASNDCIVYSSGLLQAGTDSFNFVKGEKHRVHTNVVYNGVRMRIIGHGKYPNHPFVGISPSGEVVKWNGGLRKHFVEPESTRFLSARTTEVNVENGYLNFEIVYTGKSGSTLNLMYREYSKDDVARTAFFQNLSYESSVSIIAFKNVKMEVVSATNEAITFYVRAD